MIRALAVLLTAAEGHARGDDSSEAEVAHVSIGAEGRAITLRVAPADSSAPVALCQNYCDFWTLPGRYTLYTLDNETGARHELGLRIKRSSRFELYQGDDATRDAGLGVGITGSAAILTGFILTAPALLAGMGDDSSCSKSCQSEVRVGLGLGLLVAGAVATPIGWSLFLHNRTRLKRVEDNSYRATDSAPSMRFGVVGLAGGGLGLGGVTVF